MLFPWNFEQQRGIKIIGLWLTEKFRLEVDIEIRKIFLVGVQGETLTLVLESRIAGYFNGQRGRI